MADNQIVDSLRIRALGAGSAQWPQLSASPANALWLTDSADPLNTSPNAALQVSLTPDGALLEAIAADGVAGRQLRLGNTGGVSLVPNGGKVGIGTTTASQALEVNGAVKASSFLLNDTPVVSSQWTSGGGGISFGGGNVAIGTTGPRAGLEINKQATNDLALLLSASGPGWGSGLQFKNTANAGKTYGIYSGIDGNWHFADCDNNVDRLFVDRVGNVGIGTNAPSAKLNIYPQGAGGMTIGNPNTSAGGFTSLSLSITADQDGQAEIQAIKASGSLWGDLMLNPHGGDVYVYGFHQASSRALKQNIADLSLDDALGALDGLHPVTFTYCHDTTGAVCLGFVAEDSPALVTTPQQDGVTPMHILAILSKVVKEQQRTMTALQQNLRRQDAN